MAISFGIRRIGCNDAAFVLKKMQDEPEKLGGPLRKSLVDPIKKLPQILRSRCLAYILDRGMTRTDWEETCRLVNEPGNYRLPNYNSLSLQKQTTRPKGRQFSSFYQIKSKLQPFRTSHLIMYNTGMWSSNYLRSQPGNQRSSSPPRWNL